MEVLEIKNENPSSFSIGRFVVILSISFSLFAAYYFQNIGKSFSLEDCAMITDGQWVKNSDKPSGLGCESIIASIGEQDITVEDLQIYMAKRSRTTGNQFFSLEQKQALFKELINQRLLVNQAYQLGLDQDPLVISTLEKIMVSRLREQQLEQEIASVQVSDFDIENYYQDNISDFTKLAQKRGAIIRFFVDENASLDKKMAIQNKANKVLSLAQTIPASVKGFGALAVEYSEHQASRYRGGDIGWVNKKNNRSSLALAVQNALNSLSYPGEVAPIVKAKDGFYLVKLSNIRAASTTALSEVSSRIKQTLLLTKRKAVEANWLENLGDEETIVINNLLFDEFLASNKSTAFQQNPQPPKLPTR